jgi:hypothetical protein
MLVIDDVEAVKVTPAEKGRWRWPPAQRAAIRTSRARVAHKILEVGFSLGDSDLTLRTAFPLLLFNSLDWFGRGVAGGLGRHQHPRRRRARRRRDPRLLRQARDHGSAHRAAALVAPISLDLSTMAPRAQPGW